MQTRKNSLLEATTNVTIGFAMAVAIWACYFKVTGKDVPISENLSVALVILGVSLGRGYVVRRFFERGK